MRLDALWNAHEDSWNSQFSDLEALGNDDTLEPQAKADKVWSKFNQHMENFLLDAARRSPVPMRTTKRPHRMKGAPAVFRQKSVSIHEPYDLGTPNKARVLRKLLGRLSEVQFRSWHNQELPDDHPLWIKIKRCPLWHPGRTVENTQAELDLLESETKRERLAHWRARLRSPPTEVYRWLRLRRKRDHTEALTKIREFWSQIWEREVSDEEIPPEDYLRRCGFAPVDPQHWEGVSLAALRKVAVRQKGSSGSTDGWTGDEVFCFPPIMVQAVHQLFRLIEHIGRFPAQWGESRQVHLDKGKPPRQQDEAISAANLRTISVLSVFWRWYASALMKGTSMTNWYENLLEDSQHGYRSGKDAVMAVVPLAEAWTKKHHLASLDLAQAFDRLRPTTATRIFTFFGMPSKLAQAICHFWRSQQRVLLFGPHVLPQKIRVQASLPQGCPLSPWGMNLSLKAAADIQSKFPRSKQVLFMDDRSFTSPSVTNLLNIWKAWQLHSKQLGLLESAVKTQFSSRNKPGRRGLAACDEIFPYVKVDLTALGVSFAKAGSKPTPKQLGRFRDATETALKLRAAPVLGRAKLFIAAGAACSKAAFGWVLRAPTRGLSRPYFRRVSTTNRPVPF